MDKEYKVDFLISTMHRRDISFIEKMNVRSNAIVVNQTDNENEQLFVQNGHQVKFISVKEKDLSKSRNMAIRNSDADICVICDDDLIYYNGSVEKIIGAYKRNPSADIIIFSFIPKNMTLGQNSQKNLGVSNI